MPRTLNSGVPLERQGLKIGNKCFTPLFLKNLVRTSTFWNGCWTRQPGRTWLLGPGAPSGTTPKYLFCSDWWYESNKRGVQWQKPASKKLLVRCKINFGWVLLIMFVFQVERQGKKNTPLFSKNAVVQIYFCFVPLNRVLIPRLIHSMERRDLRIRVRL